MSLLYERVFGFVKRTMKNIFGNNKKWTMKNQGNFPIKEVYLVSYFLPKRNKSWSSLKSFVLLQLIKCVITFNFIHVHRFDVLE